MNNSDERDGRVCVCGPPTHREPVPAVVERLYDRHGVQQLIPLCARCAVAVAAYAVEHGQEIHLRPVGGVERDVERPADGGCVCVVAPGEALPYRTDPACPVHGGQAPGGAS